MSHESFDKNNPNTFRALVNTFAAGNPAAFHNKDGSGYAFIADQTIELDARNPQVAPRLIFADLTSHAPMLFAPLRSRSRTLAHRLDC